MIVSPLMRPESDEQLRQAYARLRAAARPVSVEVSPRVRAHQKTRAAALRRQAGRVAVPTMNVKLAVGLGAIGLGFLIGRWWSRRPKRTTVLGAYANGLDVLGAT